LVRSLRYVLSIHAAKELESDNLTTRDFEEIVLIKSRVHERVRASADELPLLKVGS
jgi:hypothetical protein